MKIIFMLLSTLMMVMGVFSCAGDELAKTVLFTNMGIWNLLAPIMIAVTD